MASARLLRPASRGITSRWNSWSERISCAWVSEPKAGISTRPDPSPTAAAANVESGSAVVSVKRFWTMRA